jgi:hypothetical protein
MGIDLNEVGQRFKRLKRARQDIAVEPQYFQICSMYQISREYSANPFADQAQGPFTCCFNMELFQSGK